MAVDPDDPGEVADTVHEAQALFENFPWLPEPFQAVLDGKNYLPKNKFRLTLFNKQDGFMGSGDFRTHFFGDLSLVDLVRKSIHDFVFYSRAYQRWKHRSRNSRLAWRREN